MQERKQNNFLIEFNATNLLMLLYARQCMKHKEYTKESKKKKESNLAHPLKESHLVDRGRYPNKQLKDYMILNRS